MSSPTAQVEGCRKLTWGRSDGSSDDAVEDQIEDLGEDTLMDEDSSSSDEEEEQSARPYNELLQLLHANSDAKAPAPKRRKLAKDLKPEEISSTVEAEEESDQGDNALEAQAPSDDEEEAQEVDDDDDAPGPFERHFDLPESADLSKKIEQIESNKWATIKKEVDGLRLVQTTPDVENSSPSLLPVMKNTANLKVGTKHHCIHRSYN